MSIRAKIGLLLIGLTLVIATIISAAGYFALREDLLQAGLAEGEVGVAEEIARLQLLLHGVREDARVLAQSNDLLDYLEPRSAAVDSADDVFALRRVERSFEILARTQPRYLQIRYLGLTGQEQIRLNARPGQVTIVPRSELQDKSQSPIFRYISELSKDQVYVGPLDLNREEGKIEVPHQPTMRFLTPVFDREGRRRGGIVINVDGFQLLRASGEGRKDVLLLDSAGYFLRHPSSELTFGFDLDPQHDVASLAPALAEHLKHESSGAFLLDSCSYTEGVCATVYDRIQFDARPDAWWTVATERPIGAILAPLYAQTTSFLLATLVATVLAGIGGYVGARLVTRPLAALVRAARRIQTGKLDVAVAVRGKGEFAVVASTFNDMAASLKASIEGDRASLLKERLARAQLEASAAELARANRELERFVEVAAHDLRWPLERIRELAERLGDGLAPKPEPGPLDTHEAGPLQTLEAGSPQTHEAGPLETLEDLRCRVLGLERLLTDLLEFARATSFEASSEDVDLRTVIEQITALLQPPPGVVVAVAGELPVVLAPEGVLHSVFGHLIDNAIKHRDRDQCRIEVSARNQREGFEFDVKDDGPGIPPEAHERIFKIFQTLRPHDQWAGSGIGLAIVRRLLEVQGGTIRVSSTPGQRGTTFHLVWPKRARYRQAA